MNLYATKDFTRDSFARHQVSSEDIFQEIPLKVHNSHLVHAFLYELRESGNVGWVIILLLSRFYDLKQMRF